ncbi:MAG: gliding motility-associated ABC transporter substrate-binding protein GldG [Chitinophagaceae bacterium]
MKNSAFFLVAAIVILIIVNWLASQVHFRFDLTEDKRYSLNKATVNLVKNLEDPVQIDVFLKGEFPAGFRKLATTTQEFLQTIKEENSSRISYRFISPEDEIPSTGKTYADSLVSLGVSPINLTVQVKSGQENKLVYPVAIISNSNSSTIVNLYSGGRRVISHSEMNNAEAMMEYNFTKAFDDLNKTTKPLVAYSIGNGEPTQAEAYSMMEALRENYTPFLFNLNNHKIIPDTFKALIIVKPSVPYNDAQKLAIDQFVMRGGKLLWFIDGLYAEQDSLRYKTETIAFDRSLNLDDLLFRFGVRINPDLIMDLQSDFMPFAVGGDPANPQYEFLKWNYYPLFESRENHLINKNLGLVSGRFVNSIDTVGGEGLQKTILLSSSSNSRLLKTPVLISLNENRNTPQDAAFRESNIPAAVLVEGKFSSLYKARVSRNTMDSLSAVGFPFKDASDENKIIIVSDGDIVLNDVSTQYGPLPLGMNLFTAGTQYEYQFANKQFFINCLEYLLSNPDIIQTRNKEIVLRLLDSKKVNDQKATWQLINIALPIFIVMLSGFIYQYLRKRKYTA